MTIIEISKKQICKWILKEPKENFGTGSWFRMKEGEFLSEEEQKSNLLPLVEIEKSCSVCAVGAIAKNLLNKNKENLRSAESLIKNELISDNYLVSMSVFPFDNLILKCEEMIKDGYYFNALSCIFEWHMYNALYKAFMPYEEINIKPILVNFIKKYFPETLQIDIEDREPSPYVRII